MRTRRFIIISLPALSSFLLATVAFLVPISRADDEIPHNLKPTENWTWEKYPTRLPPNTHYLQLIQQPAHTSEWKLEGSLASINVPRRRGVLFVAVAYARDGDSFRRIETSGEAGSGVREVRSDFYYFNTPVELAGVEVLSADSLKRESEKAIASVSGKFKVFPFAGMRDFRESWPDKFLFDINDGSGKQLSNLPGKSLAGKVIVIDFWATFCAPCLRKMPTLAKLSEKYPQLEVISVNLDADIEKAMNVIKNRGSAKWHLLVPAKEHREALMTGMFGVPNPGIPQIVIIDRDGRLQHIWPDDLELVVEELIPSPRPATTQKE